MDGNGELSTTVPMYSRHQHDSTEDYDAGHRTTPADLKIHRQLHSQWLQTLCTRCTCTWSNLFTVQADNLM